MSQGAVSDLHSTSTSRVDCISGLFGEAVSPKRDEMHHGDQRNISTESRRPRVLLPHGSRSTMDPLTSKQLLRSHPRIAKETPRAPPFLGCDTCRRRKVKCNKVRPICDHCQRLHLDCVYRRGKPAPRTSGSVTVTAEFENSTQLVQTVPVSYPSHRRNTPASQKFLKDSTSSIDADNFQPSSAFSSHFSAAPFFESLSNQKSRSLQHPSVNGLNVAEMEDAVEKSHEPQCPDSVLESDDPELFDVASLFNIGTPVRGQSPFKDIFNELYSGQPSQGLFRPGSSSAAGLNTQLFNQSFLQDPSPAHEVSCNSSTEIALLQHFVDVTTPPILLGVEASWNSTRDSLVEVAKSNAFVRHAICAFSSMSLKSSTGVSPPSAFSLPYYEMASKELFDAIDTYTLGDQDQRFYEGVLASIFFLSYIELTMAASPQKSLELLRRAHDMCRSVKLSWSALGKRFRIWLKLLDTKAVLAGGEGVYLSSTADIERVEETDNPVTPHSGPKDAGNTEEASDAATEDIFFNAIHHRAYNFYLQVLSLQGRVAKLDKWHRPRGTVKDETEVMAIASKLIQDLEKLWLERPAILDFADQPERIRRFICPNLALKIGRSLRTYLANYYSCYLHLQRAVYYYLPTMPEVTVAVQRIVHLCRLSLQEHPKFPASMLWPLMLTACEMRDDATRDWVVECIEDMHEGLGNATRTAALVREILKRQAGGVRADARTVMQEMFGSIFAIL